MPELPEVETIRRGIEPAIAGRTVVGLRFAPNGERLLQGVPVDWFVARLQGRRFEAAKRRGKYLLFPLDDDRTFVAHLRMTGRIEVEAATRPEGDFFRAAIQLDNGNELRWRDVRRFGTWELLDDLLGLEAKLGPEPLDAAYVPAKLGEACRGRQTPVKSLLLDQRRVAGLGNIYVDEGLHQAGLHPLRSAGTLTDEEVVRLHAALQAVLRKGIENFGTTMRDFVDAYGQAGRNREQLQVYQRTGQACYRCRQPIARIVVGGRGTHFCPDCQPAPPKADAL